VKSTRAAVPLFSGWNCVATQLPWRTAHTKRSPYSEHARAQAADPSGILISGWWPPRWAEKMNRSNEFYPGFVWGRSNVRKQGEYRRTSNWALETLHGYVSPEKEGYSNHCGIQNWDYWMLDSWWYNQLRDTPFVFTQSIQQLPEPVIKCQDKSVSLTFEICWVVPLNFLWGNLLLDHNSIINVINVELIPKMLVLTTLVILYPLVNWDN